MPLRQLTIEAGLVFLAPLFNFVYPNSVLIFTLTLVNVSIARALLKEAPILILDDSVSAVDTKTEREILKNLRQTRRGKTTILIAHRISTIQEMDKLLYLEDGQITAVGTHEQLYESCPGYRKMVDLQKLEEEEGGNGHA